MEGEGEMGLGLEEAGVELGRAGRRGCWCGSGYV